MTADPLIPCRIKPQIQISAEVMRMTAKAADQKETSL
jgi:hypothetical protein